MDRADFLKLSAVAAVAPVGLMESPRLDEMAFVRDCVSAPWRGMKIGPDNRGPGILKLYLNGVLQARERRNDVKCPHCNGQFHHVYRWPAEQPYADGRWFCLCGYTEFPDGDRESWEKGL